MCSSTGRRWQEIMSTQDQFMADLLNVSLHCLLRGVLARGRVADLWADPSPIGQKHQALQKQAANGMTTVAKDTPAVDVAYYLDQIAAMSSELQRAREDTARAEAERDDAHQQNRQLEVSQLRTV